MQANQLEEIDLVVVNLYPFEQVTQQGADYAKAIENIDIGGPSMIRATAKNHKFTTIITDPADYEQLYAELSNDNQTSFTFRQAMAVKAFARTAKYDAAIYNWFN